MALRTFTVYLEGGAAFTIKAARYDVTAEGVFFYGEADKPLVYTYINPASVIAVLPPAPTSEGSKAGFIRA
jgi:hypothetical protein